MTYLCYNSISLTIHLLESSSLPREKKEQFYSVDFIVVFTKSVCFLYGEDIKIYINLYFSFTKQIIVHNFFITVQKLRLIISTAIHLIIFKNNNYFYL